MPLGGSGSSRAPRSQEIIYSDDSCDNKGAPVEMLTRTQKKELPRELANADGYRAIRGKSILLGVLQRVLQPGFAVATSLYLESSGASEVGWTKHAGTGQLKALRADNKPELLAASIFPAVSSETSLLALSRFLFWVVQWNHEGALRKETLNYMRARLGLVEDADLEILPTSEVVLRFDEVAEGLRAGYDGDQLERLCGAFDRYMAARHHESVSQATAPMTLKGFLASTYNMSIAPVWLSLLEFGSVRFDDALRQSVPARNIFRATTKMIALSDNLYTSKNDILAFKNQKTGNLLITILFAKKCARSQSAQKAADLGIERIFKIGVEFEEHAARLVRKFGKTDQTDALIQGCRFMVGGFIRWCNECPVYGAGRLYGDALEYDSGMQLGERAMIEDYDITDHLIEKPFLAQFEGDHAQHYRANKPKRKKARLT